MKAHPLSNYLPELDSNGIKELAENIKEHGQREPIVMLDEMILDGRNRFAACKIAKVEPKFREFKPKQDGDPIAFVLSANVFRRHLSENQRIDIAAELAKESERGRPEKPSEKDGAESGEKQNGQANPPTIEQSAELMKVSPSAVARAVRVKKQGSAELQRAVKEGKISVSKAAKALKQPKEKQLKEAKSKPKKEKRESPKEKLLNALDQLWIDNRQKWNETPMVTPAQMVKHVQKLIKKVL